METDETLSIVKEKIADLPCAVLYSMNQHGVKFPADNINFARIDDDAQIWFISHFPNKLLKECDLVFPARLHFYKEESDATLEISGKATIMSSVSDTQLFTQEDAEVKKSVLIKMIMNNIQYTESVIIRGKSKLRLLAERAYKWIVRLFSLDPEHA